MTVADYKKQIKDRFIEGQEIFVYLKPEEKKEAVPVKVRIIAFYTNHVLTERRGFKESYTYYEFERVTRQPAKKGESGLFIIPEAVTRRKWSASHHKKKKHY